MTERSLCRVTVDHGGGLVKRRFGIVLKLKYDGAIAVVAYGTGTARDIPRVAIEMGTQVWRGLAPPLEKPTYLYPGNVAAFVANQVEDLGKKCPPGFFIELWAMVEQETKFRHAAAPPNAGV